MDAVLSEAARAAEAASNGKALDVVARWGFAVMALLHIVVGAIAIACYVVFALVRSRFGRM